MKKRTSSRLRRAVVSGGQWSVKAQPTVGWVYPSSFFVNGTFLLSPTKITNKTCRACDYGYVSSTFRKTFRSVDFSLYQVQC